MSGYRTNRGGYCTALNMPIIGWLILLFTGSQPDKEKKGKPASFKIANIDG
jgi:hypothetical protein